MAQLKEATDYILDKLWLINGVAEPIDLRKAMQTMTITESIGADGIVGEMRVLDVDQNIRETFPITGSEKIQIEFRTDSEAPSWKKTMWVSGLGDEVIKDNNKRIFTIFFVSEILWNNNQRLSKYYEGTNASIVSEILGDVLLQGVQTDFNPVIHETKYQRKFISPNWKPLKIINHLAKESISTEGFNDFMFYENKDGVNFLPLSWIIGRKEYSVGITEDNIGDSDPLNNNPLKILTKQLDRSFDMELTHQNGGVSNSLYTHDILNKGLNEWATDYDREFNRYADEDGVSGSTPIFRNSFFGGVDNASYYYSGKYNISSENYNNSKVNEQLMQRQIKMNSWEQHKLNLGFGSNSNITIGTHLYVDWKSWSRDLHIEIDRDQQYNGRWLVHTVVHSFHQTKQHMTFVKLMKDAFSYHL